MKRALDGVKVADFGWNGAAPVTAMLLAACGATVVKIESISAIDPWRTSSPFKDKKAGVNRSGYFALHNTGKYSIAINLNNPRAMEAVRRIISWADVVVENFAPGVMEKRGLGYEDLKKIKPDIIMVRLSSQGQTGPVARHPGLGFHLVALTGFCYYTGWPDREPAALSTPYTDCVIPRFAAAALIAALVYRRKTGKGQLLDLGQLEIGTHFLAPLVLDYTVNQRVGNRMGNYCPYGAPHGVYRCQGDERWCAIAVFSDEDWRRFCQAIGNPTWAKYPKFSTFLNRKKHEEELNNSIEQWTGERSAEEVMTVMQAAGIAAGVVSNAEDVYQDPQLREREALWLLNHQEMGAVTHLGQPFNLSKTPAEPGMPAPCLGEHTEYICKELLNMSGEEFDELLVAGVFE